MYFVLSLCGNLYSERVLRPCYFPLVLFTRFHSHERTVLVTVHPVTSERQPFLFPAGARFAPAVSVMFIFLHVYAMEMYFASFTSGFASFFGISSFRTPSSNLALMSFCVISSPT